MLTIAWKAVYFPYTSAICMLTLPFFWSLWRAYDTRYGIKTPRPRRRKHINSIWKSLAEHREMGPSEALNHGRDKHYIGRAYVLLAVTLDFDISKIYLVQLCIFVTLTWQISEPIWLGMEIKYNYRLVHYTHDWNIGFFIHAAPHAWISAFRKSHGRHELFRDTKYPVS